MIRFVLIFAISLICALPLRAADWDGFVWAGFQITDDASGFGFLDVTASFNLSHSYPLTLEVGAYEFVLPEKRPHETYVALTWDDRFRLGVVRPAYDTVLPSKFEHIAPYLSYERAEYSRARTTTLALRDGAVPFGLSYQSRPGDWNWAVSAHSARGGEFHSASAAASYEKGPWTVAAAVEGLWPDHSDGAELNAKAGVTYTKDNWAVGLSFFHPSAHDDPDILALDLFYKATRDLSLYLVSELAENSDFNAHGFGLSYSISDRAALTAAITQTGNQETAGHFGLSWRF